MLLIGKDTLKVLDARFDLKKNIGIFPGAGEFEDKVLRESRAGHMMVPMLPESYWEFLDFFVPSETAGPLVFSTNVKNENFSVKRLPGSRTIRDLMVTSGRGHFLDSIGLVRELELLPEVEPQNLDFDVNEFLRSSPNPVAASVFGDSEIIRRAAVRREYAVMRSRFFESWR